MKRISIKEVEKILGVENFDEFRYFTAAKTDSELFRNNPILKSIVLTFLIVPALPVIKKI